MQKNLYSKIILMLAVIAISQSVSAREFFLKKGYINNNNGKKCWYTQKTDPENRYFHETMTSNVGIMTFDDQRCMSDPEFGLFGLNAMKKVINNVISGWYSHSDAAFKTGVDELYPGSLFQKRGLCIQSTKYPSIGITVDYEVKNNSIVKVRHGVAADGCKK